MKKYEAVYEILIPLGKNYKQKATTYYEAHQKFQHHTKKIKDAKSKS